MTAPSLSSRGLTVAVVAAVLAIFALAYLDLRREQARALEDYRVEQAALAQAVAATVSARVSAVLRDLEVVAALDPPAGHVLDRLVRHGRLYRAAQIVGPAGDPLAEATDGTGSRLERSSAFQQARAELLRSVTSEDAVVVSAAFRPEAEPTSRVRLFAHRGADRTALLAVDCDRLFAGIREAAAERAAAPSRWLVADDGGQLLEIDAARAGTSWQQVQGVGEPDVLRLVQRMRAGGEGTELLGRSAAGSLGLDHRMAVAGFAAVPVPGRHWSVAVVASAMRVRDRARLAAWRLAAATGLTALLLASFAVMVVRQQRRAQALTEALRLAAATSALRERSEKIVDNIPVGVLSLDAQGRVTAVNPYLADRGVRPSESLAHAFLDATPGERAPLDAIAQAARSTRRPAHQHALSLRLGRQIREVDAYAVPLANPLPDVDSFVVVHDRTDMRQLERSLIRAEKLATIGTLAAGVAHEVGTPLGIISGRAEQLLARASGDAADPARKSVLSILAQVDKVSTTIRQLLDFARVRPVTVEAVSPAQAVEGAATLLEHRFRQAKVELRVAVPPALPSVAADRGQLEQVLVNLLINACDACKAGGSVRAGAELTGACVVFAITDDGVGIPPEHLSAVLDPFFTTKKRGQGTGLGLTIAADIIKNHGGALRIESVVDQGTTMRVEWPLSQERTA